MPGMMRYPIGIQNLREIRQEGYAYVDKSPFVARMASQGKYYFLSRPRRFGKSLFLDTLAEAFSGNKALFEGLYLEKNWDWAKKYPIVRISFGGGQFQTSRDLEIRIYELLSDNARRFGVTLTNTSIPGRFSELIGTVRKQQGSVVVLIDEYDKPILDIITNPTEVSSMREGLKSLYSVLKDSDADLKFAFLTGVSKFAQVSVFSGLNQLRDISLNSEYGAICGYTQTELETVFAEPLRDVDPEELKTWYNGYNFLGEKVYNPFCLLLFFQNQRFCNYWFQSGTPTFLVKLFQEKHVEVPRLDGVRMSENMMDSFDIENIKVETLLFQTGYLTITEVLSDPYDLRIQNYVLGFPNREVRMSFTAFFVEYFAQSGSVVQTARMSLMPLLHEGNAEGLKAAFDVLFASIPHQWYTKNDLASYEAFYASIFFCAFHALGLDVRAEEPTNKGRVDLVVRLPKFVYLFEFKVVEFDTSGQKALDQIKARGYPEKYRNPTHELILVGIEFSEKSRGITGYAVERTVPT